MFLSKKNAVYFNKPKNLNPLQPKRILNGNLHLIQAGKTKKKTKKIGTTMQSPNQKPKPPPQTFCSLRTSRTSLQSRFQKKKQTTSSTLTGML